MPHVLTARDGRNHTVSDERDLFQVVAEYMGSDFRDWLEEWADDYKSELQDELDEARETAKETEKELDELKDHQRQVFTNVYEEAERLMDLAKQSGTSEVRNLTEKIWDVILIGIATAEIPMKQKMIRTMLRKKDRKPEQFLESDTPLASAPDWVKTGIQAMLLGPSAVNQQPVNIVLSGGKVTMKIRKNGNSLQNNDMGIAKYQFAVGAAECGVKGKWQWGDGGEFEVQE